MRLRQLYRTYLRSWKQHTTLQLATMAVLMGSFAIISSGLLIHHNLEKILSRWGDAIELTVYLKDNIKEVEKDEIQRKLKEFSGLSKVEYISKDSAAKMFKDRMRTLVPDLLNDKEFGNPLPASFEVQIKKELSGNQGMSSLSDLILRIEGLLGVDEVSYGQGWIENYASLVTSFEWTSWIMAFILISGTIFVVGNSIRSSISQRREEVAIMELFGATKTMIQAPFIFEGAMLGFMAGTFSLLLSYFLFAWQSQVFNESLGFWGLGATLEFLSLTKCFLVLLLSVLCGAIGSYVCVRSLNRGWLAAENMEL